MNFQVFSCNGQDVLIKPKSHRRAKRLSLRVAPQEEKTFVLIVPLTATEAHIRAFLQYCTPWMEKHLHKVFHVKHFKPGEEVTLHGTSFQCREDPLRRRPALCQTTRSLLLPPRCAPPLLHEFLKKIAMEILTPYVLEAAEALGQASVKVSFRDTRSRWGSCSARKTISLNWRLILAPPAVAQYVCIHEAVHLRHMNHSQAFWQTVKGLCPDYVVHKKWLKAHGYSLLQV